MGKVEDTETLGARIARLRRAAGLSQNDLAQKTGIPLGTIRNWEQLNREPGANVIVRLADALGVSADTVLRAPSVQKPSRRKKS